MFGLNTRLRFLPLTEKGRPALEGPLLGENLGFPGGVTFEKSVRHGRGGPELRRKSGLELLLYVQEI